MLVQITTDGICDKEFQHIREARAECVRYFKEHPNTNLSAEILGSGKVKGWVILENGHPIWKKNCGRFFEYYTLDKDGRIPGTALQVLDGRQLFEACQDNDPLPYTDALKIKRPDNAKSPKRDHKGYLFQAVDTNTWKITRHCWNIRTAKRYSDLDREVVIYVPSRRIVDFDN